MSNTRADAPLLAALAGGSTMRGAAEIVGLSDRTVRRRMNDPDFQRRLEEARAAVVERTVGHLAEAAAEAASALRKLVRDSPDQRARVRAALDLIDLAGRTRAGHQLQKEVAELRRQVEELQRSAGRLRLAAPNPGQGEG